MHLDHSKDFFIGRCLAMSADGDLMDFGKSALNNFEIILLEVSDGKSRESCGFQAGFRQEKNKYLLRAMINRVLYNLFFLLPRVRDVDGRQYIYISNKTTIA